MIQEIVNKWEENKHLLEYYFKNNHQREYEYHSILEKIIEIVIKDAFHTPISNELYQIDDGDYQGTLIFIFHLDTYQPRENQYFVTVIDYGSCSGCDTLENIRQYNDGIPSENQVKEYMTLSLHMIQNMKYLYDKIITI